MSEENMMARSLPASHVTNADTAFPLMDLPPELRKRCFELYFQTCVVCIAPPTSRAFRTINYVHGGTRTMDDELRVSERAIMNRDPTQRVAPCRSRVYHRHSPPVSEDVSALLCTSRTICAECMPVFRPNLHFRLHPAITLDELLASAARIGLTNRTRLGLDTEPPVPFRLIKSLQIHMSRSHRHQQCFSRLWYRIDVVDGRVADDFAQFEEAMPALQRLLIEVQQNELFSHDYVPQAWLARRLWPVRNLEKIVLVDGTLNKHADDMEVVMLGYENVLKKHCQLQMTDTDYSPGWPQVTIGDITSFRLPRESPSERTGMAVLVGVSEFVDLLQPSYGELRDRLAQLQARADLDFSDGLYAD